VILRSKPARLAHTRRIPHGLAVPDISSKGEARRLRLPQASVLEPPTATKGVSVFLIIPDDPPKRTA
jgi:hypothetical protein